MVSVLRSYGDAAHCRKALHRAVQCTSDYPEHVCEVLLAFERVEGKCCGAQNKLQAVLARRGSLLCWKKYTFRKIPLLVMSLLSLLVSSLLIHDFLVYSLLLYSSVTLFRLSS